MAEAALALVPVTPVMPVMPAAGRELLFARVIARLVWLRHAGVLDGPAQLHADAAPREAAAAMLWEWSRLISDVHELLDAVFEPATREPGRLHRRETVERRDRPRGAVHWPRTAQLALRRADGGLRFVCTAAHRSLLAPENVLMIWTLDELIARGLLLGGRFAGEALLADDQLETVQQVHARLRVAAATPWVAACREAIRELRHAGPGAELELERTVAERVRGRPSAAPDWARALLELRRMPVAIPSESALDSIDARTLWEQLSLLELLGVLRGWGVLRRRGSGFAGARGLDVARIEDTPAWAIAVPGRAVIGVLCPTDGDWEAVRMQALYWSWTARREGVDIDRWVILHRSGAPFGVRRRGGIELCFCDLQPDAGLDPLLRRELLGWLDGRLG